MYRFYQEVWVPFGLILSDMEARGMAVNRQLLREAEARAKEDKERSLATFMSWAKAQVPAAELMNPYSQSQVGFSGSCCCFCRPEGPLQGAEAAGAHACQSCCWMVLLCESAHWEPQPSY